MLDEQTEVARDTGGERLITDEEPKLDVAVERRLGEVGGGDADDLVVDDDWRRCGGGRAAPRSCRYLEECRVGEAKHRDDEGTVKDLEDQTEALLQLRLPLLQDRRRRRDDYRLDLLPQEKLARNQARFDRLAKAGVIGNEQAHARQPQRLAQRLHLVGVDLDACPERCLEEVRIGRRDAVPPQRVQEGGKLTGLVEAPRREIPPALLFQNPTVDLVIPPDLEHLALGIIIGTGEPHQRRLAGTRRGDDLLDQPAPRAHLHEIARARWLFRKCQAVCLSWVQRGAVLLARGEPSHKSG